MRKKLKIVIADDSTELGQNCAKALKGYGMDVVLCQKDDMDKKERPMVMAMSSFDNQRLEKETLDAGASYYFLKPFDINTMAERIIQLSGWKNEISPVVVKDNVVTDPELELMVTEIIHQIGVPAHIKGYHYLREAIILSIKNSEIINSVTKLL